MEEKITNFQIINQLELEAKYLKCANCKLWLTIPIFLRSDGLNYCGLCSTPTDAGQQINDALGHVLANLKYPCLFANCDFVATQQSIQIHMLTCIHRSVTCVLCKEAALNENTIAKHFEAKHANAITKIPIEEPVAILKLDKPLKDKIFLITLKDNVFIVFVKAAGGVLSFKVGKQKLNESILDDMFVIQYETDDNELKVKGKTNSLQEVIDDYSKPWKLQMNVGDAPDQIELKIFFNGFQLMQCVMDECPICLNKLTKEIFQCPNGHNVCSLCANNINDCAICKIAVSKTKIFLKHVFSNIPFPCPNADAGCIHFIKFAVLDSHIVDCVHANVKCVQCEKACSKLTIFGHMYEEHEGGRTNLERNRELQVAAMFEKTEHFVVFKNQMFRFTRTSNGTDDNQKLCYNVQLLFNDDRNAALRYRYEIQILSGTHGCIAKYKVDNVCQSLSDDSISSTIHWSVCKPFLEIKPVAAKPPEKEEASEESYFSYRYCVYDFVY